MVTFTYRFTTFKKGEEPTNRNDNFNRRGWGGGPGGGGGRPMGPSPGGGRRW